MNGRSMQLLVGVVTSGLVVAALLSVSRYQRSRSQAIRAQRQLEECRLLGKSIFAMQTIPARASLEFQTAHELAMCVQEAAQSAEMDSTAVASITPQASRRVGDSAYQEQNNDLDIRQVTLRQLVRFLNEIIARKSGLRVTSIRLQSPREKASSDDNEFWSAEVTLTHLVFSPKKAGSLL